MPKIIVLEMTFFILFSLASTLYKFVHSLPQKRKLHLFLHSNPDVELALRKYARENLGSLTIEKMSGS